MNQTISVIVPVYNVEKYLPECLDSLCGQTYRDLEILVVDDGSTDHSGEICDRYAARDGRIRVIHQKNGGAANAKNTALRLASGAYLTFADSDDYVEPDAYEFMLRELQNKQVDVIQCAHQKMFRDHEILYSHGSETEIENTEAYLKRFTTDWKCGLLWNKLYKLELFKGVFFEEGHKIDDEYFTYRGIMNARKILLSPHVIYHYRMRKSSVMTSRSSMEQIVQDRLDVIQKRRKNILIRFPQLRTSYDEHYANSLLLLLHDPYVTDASILQAQQQIRMFLSERPRPKVNLQMKLQLWRMIFLNSRKILTEIDQNIVPQDLTMYFD